MSSEKTNLSLNKIKEKISDSLKKIFGPYIADYDNYVQKYCENNYVEVQEIYEGFSQEFYEKNSSMKELHLDELQNTLVAAENLPFDKCFLSYSLSVLRLIRHLILVVRTETYEKLLRTDLPTDEKKKICKQYRMFFSIVLSFQQSELEALVISPIRVENFYLGRYLTNGQERMRFSEIAVDGMMLQESLMGRECYHSIIQVQSWRLLDSPMELVFGINNLCDIIILNFRQTEIPLPEDILEIIPDLDQTSIDLNQFVMAMIETSQYYLSILDSKLREHQFFEELKSEEIKTAQYLTSDDISVNFEEIRALADMGYTQDMIDDFIICQKLIQAGTASIDALRWIVETLSSENSSKVKKLFKEYHLVITGKTIMDLKKLKRKMISLCYSEDAQIDYEDYVNEVKTELLGVYEEKIDVTRTQINNWLSLIDTINQQDISSYMTASKQLLMQIPDCITEETKKRLAESLEKLYSGLKKTVSQQTDFDSYKRQIERIGIIEQYKDFLSDTFLTTLATAEYLFKKFVDDTAEMNYNMNSLAFLESFEIEINNLIYTKYIENIYNQNSDRITIESENSLKFEGSSSEFRALTQKYFGSKITSIRKPFISNSIEMGPLGYLLYYCDGIEELSNFILHKYPQIDFSKIKDIGKEISNPEKEVFSGSLIKDERNSAAHGSRVFSKDDLINIRSRMFSENGLIVKLLHILNNSENPSNVQ